MVTSSLQTESIDVGIESDSTAVVYDGITSPVEKSGRQSGCFSGHNGGSRVDGDTFGDTRMSIHGLDRPSV